MTLVDFLGPGISTRQNIGWPIKIEELCNHLKVAKVI